MYLVSFSMSKTRSFAFTWNNYPEDSLVKLEALSFKYLVVGREVGDSGTRHLQGHIVFKSPTSLSSAIKKLPGCHVEIARDTDASIVYCKKGGDFSEFGSHSSRASNALSQTAQRAARNKVLIESSIKDLVETGQISFSQAPVIAKAKNVFFACLEPYRHSSPRGVWVHGPPGTGKTHDAREKYPDAYIKAQNKWFDGYTGQTAIILDDFDSEVMGHYIKIWTDQYPFSGETKFGHVQLIHHVFYITSNYSPEELFSKDPVMAAAIRRRCDVIFKGDHVFNGCPRLVMERVSACNYP